MQGSKQMIGAAVLLLSMMAGCSSGQQDAGPKHAAGNPADEAGNGIEGRQVVITPAASAGSASAPKASAVVSTVTCPAYTVEASPAPVAGASPEAKGTVGTAEGTELEALCKVLANAAELDKVFYSKGPYTLDEIYAYYEPYFTRGYVDRVVLGKTGNLSRDGDRYSLEEGRLELAEGTYFHPELAAGTRLESPDGKTRLIFNPQPDGLYAPHTEILTLRLVNGQWKIDELKWEPAS